MCVFQSHPAQDNYFSLRSRSPPPPSPPFSFFLPVGVYTLANTFTRYECLSFFHLFLTSLNCNHLAACHTTVSLFSLFHLSFCSLRLVPLSFLRPHFHSSSFPFSPSLSSFFGLMFPSSASRNYQLYDITSNNVHQLHTKQDAAQTFSLHRHCHAQYSQHSLRR